MVRFSAVNNVVIQGNGILRRLNSGIKQDMNSTLNNHGQLDKGDKERL